MAVAFFTVTAEDKSAPVYGFRDSSGLGVLSTTYTFVDRDGEDHMHVQAAWESSSPLTFGGSGYYILDNASQSLGVIQGVPFTWHRALFNLANGEGKVVGVAYVDFAMTHVVVVDAQRPRRRLATFDRHTSDRNNDPDFWTMEIERSFPLSDEVLWALAFYVVDYQDWGLIAAVRSLLPGSANFSEASRKKLSEKAVDSGLRRLGSNKYRASRRTTKLMRHAYR